MITVLPKLRYCSSVLIVSALISLFFSCEKREDDLIPAHDKPFFGTGDTLLYEDDSGVVDSLVVKVASEMQVHDKRYYHEFLSIHYSKIENGTTGARGFLLIQQSSHGANVANFGKYLYSCCPDKTPLDSYTLKDGTIIKNVTISKREGEDLQYPDVVEIFYSPHYGIFRYKYAGSEHFELTRVK